MRPPESWQRARVTLGIAAATSIAWLLTWVADALDFIALWGGFIPARVNGVAEDLTAVPVALTPLTATLIHGDFAHLALNVVVLLYCGRATENILGPLGLALLYVIGAYTAAAFHYALDPASQVVGVGASGAISAVLGAFAILFGRNRVKVNHHTLALWLHALWLAAAWIVLQFILSLTFEAAFTTSAAGAHIGGFLAGLLLAKPLLLFRYRRA